MTRRSSLVLVLPILFGCAAEGPKGPRYKVGEPVDINGDGSLDGIATDQDNDGVADSVDLDGDMLPDARFPWLNPKPMSGSADDAGDGPTTGDGDGDGGKPASGDGDGDGDGDEPPLVIELPVAKVPCGASSCESKDAKLCCQSWKSTGFGTTSDCLTEAECTITGPNDTGKYYMFEDLLHIVTPIDPDRAVMSRCDGMEDCGAGQVCCYVSQGMPLGSPGMWTGPGAGRQCMSVEDCSAEGSANGIPTGKHSCNDDFDCRKAEGTTCQPEQNNTATTGANVAARPDFKVCR